MVEMGLGIVVNATPVEDPVPFVVITDDLNPCVQDDNPNPGVQDDDLNPNVYDDNPNPGVVKT